MRARMQSLSWRGLFAGFSRPEAVVQEAGIALAIRPLDRRPLVPAGLALGLALLVGLVQLAVWGGWPDGLDLAFLGVTTLPLLVAAAAFVAAPRWLDAKLVRGGEVLVRERGVLGGERIWSEPLAAYADLHAFTEHWTARAPRRANADPRNPRAFTETPHARGWLVLRHAGRPHLSLPLARVDGGMVAVGHARALADALGLTLSGIGGDAPEA